LIQTGSRIAESKMAYLVDFVAFSPEEKYRQRSVHDVTGKWVHWGPEHGVRISDQLKAAAKAAATAAAKAGKAAATAAERSAAEGPLSCRNDLCYGGGCTTITICLAMSQHIM
jgi:hypothetical protein